MTSVAISGVSVMSASSVRRTSMSRPVRGGASYRAVLALPHARSLFAAAMLARLSYGLLSLPLLLTLRQSTGSYAVAGTGAGALT